MELSPAQLTFIERWGELGTRWGIGRSTAMIHGLLYLSPQSLSPEVICVTLSMARSNASTSLRELEDWGLAIKESRLGDRKSYYTCISDVWDMAKCVLAERKKREADGALRSVKEALFLAREEKDLFLISRLEAMDEILNDSCAFADIALSCSPSVLKRMLKMGSRVFHWIGKS